MTRLLLTSAALPPFVLAFQTPFGSFLASPTIVACAHLLRYGVTFSDDGPGLLSSDRRTIDIAQLIGAIFLEDDVYPIQEMSSAGTDSLRVMFALVHHLIVVDDGNLWIELAGDIGVDITILFDQAGTSLRYVEPFALGVTAPGPLALTRSLTSSVGCCIILEPGGKQNETSNRAVQTVSQVPLSK